MKSARRLRHWLVGAILAAWAVGLGVAGIRLHAWSEAMAQILVAIQADTLLRGNAPDAPQTLQPRWHRQRALAMMAALEQLDDPSSWRWAMPGSWASLDDLEDRLRARIGRAFGQVVTQTLRRELGQQAGAATGTRLLAADGSLVLAAGCRPPQASPGAAASATLALESLPEFIAMQQLLDEAGRLEAAAAALRRLRQRPARASDLQLITRSLLGAEAPGSASRSLTWFESEGTGDPGDPGFHRVTQRLQRALQCAVQSGMQALHQRLAPGNPLLALDDAVQETTRANLFDGEARAVPVRLQEAVARLDSLEKALATASPDWMQEEAPAFGMAHQSLLERMATMSLLGPDIARALALEAEAAQSDLHHRLAARRTRLQPRPGGVGFALAPELVDLRLALQALLQEPIVARPDRFLEEPMPEALGQLGDQRLRCEREVLPRLPHRLSRAAGRFIDRRVAESALQVTRRWLDEDGGAMREMRLRLLQDGLEAASDPALSAWLGERLAEESLSTRDAPGGLRSPSDNEGAGEAPASSAD